MRAAIACALVPPAKSRPHLRGHDAAQVVLEIQFINDVEARGVDEHTRGGAIRLDRCRFAVIGITRIDSRRSSIGRLVVDDLMPLLELLIGRTARPSCLFRSRRRWLIAGGCAVLIGEIAAESCTGHRPGRRSRPRAGWFRCADGSRTSRRWPCVGDRGPAPRIALRSAERSADRESTPQRRRAAADDVVAAVDARKRHRI